MPKTYKNPGPINFTTIIQRSNNAPNTWAWIEFPYDLKETFGVGNLIPVTVTFDKKVTYSGSIAKMGKGAQIVVRKDVRTDLSKGPGDKVEVAIVLDDKPRKIEVAEDIKSSLVAAGYWEVFDKLAFSHRKEYVQWIEGAKKPETRAARIQKTCDMLSKNIKNP